MTLGTQEHAADQVGGGDARGALDDLEAVGGLDEAVAILAIAIGGNVVTVHDVLAAVMANPVKLRDVWGVGDGLGHPAARIDSGDSSKKVSGVYLLLLKTKGSQLKNPEGRCPKRKQKFRGPTVLAGS